MALFQSRKPTGLLAEHLSRDGVEARFARLMKIFLEQGRQDEIVRATVSASGRQQMYKEHNIA